MSLPLNFLRVALLERTREQHDAGAVVAPHLHPAVARPRPSILTRSFCQAGTPVALGVGVGDALGDGDGLAMPSAPGLVVGSSPPSPFMQAERVDDRQDEEADDGDEDDGVAAAVAVRLADDRRAAERLVVLGGRRDRARAVLADDDLGVEAEIGGVRAQEALDVRGARA